LEWLDQIISKNGIVGIEILSDGLAVVAKGCLGGDSEIDVVGLLVKASPYDNVQEELNRFTRKHKIGKRLCHLVLHPKDYQLLLVEAPDVPDADLREAVRWRVKDLLSMPLEQAVIDVFKLPADANKSSKQMVYAVVSELARIQELIQLVSESGLKLSSIDIGEMAMRNVSLLLPDSMQERGIGITRISEGGGIVSLYRKGNLYLSRQFQLDYRAGLLDSLPADSLALEVQRSLDYYERQMGLSPPAVLYICGENVSEDKITQKLIHSLNIPAKYLDVSESLSLAQDVDESMMQLCVGALGGAYREAFV